MLKYKLIFSTLVKNFFFEKRHLSKTLQIHFYYHMLENFIRHIYYPCYKNSYICMLLFIKFEAYMSMFNYYINLDSSICRFLANNDYVYEQLFKIEPR